MTDDRILALVPVAVIVAGVLWGLRREITIEVRYRVSWWRWERALARRDRLRAGVARDITREVRRVR